MKKESLKEKNNLFVYIMLFFALAFIGWCFEVLNEIRKGHGFINRGVLHGPWLPIYGFGGLIIYILLKKFYKKPIIVFSLSFLISAVIEYFTSFYLEITKGMVWWDYSKKPFNINGRICLLYTLVFALLATILYYFVIPKIIDLLVNFCTRGSDLKKYADIKAQEEFEQSLEAKKSANIIEFKRK